jgi:hypothetical protein
MVKHHAGRIDMEMDGQLPGLMLSLPPRAHEKHMHAKVIATAKICMTKQIICICAAEHEYVSV